MDDRVTETSDAAPSPAPVSGAAFRDAMSRVAAAVHIVATGGPAGRSGFTATAVAPVSDAPPTVLACLKRESRAVPLLQANGVFCINTLTADDQRLADVFAGRAGLQLETRFAHGTWERLATGAPVLAGALVSLDCRLVDMRPVATHHVLVGEVVAVRLGPRRTPLIYVDRHYRRV